MSWLFYALLAPAINTIVNFIDKHIISNEMEDYRGFVVYGTIASLFIGTFFWMITGFPVLPLQDTMIALGSGMLSVWASVLYFKAISKEDASKVIILFQTIPVFVLILSVVVLKETITTLQILGFFLILGSAIGISIEKGQGKFKLSKTFWIVMAANLIWAISTILAKFSIQESSFESILAYERWGHGIGGTLLFIFVKPVRESFFKSIKTIPKKTLLLMFSNEGLIILAQSIELYAYALGPTSLVSVLSSTHALFGILYGYILTRLLPKYFKEDLKKEAMIKKSLLGILIIIGICLMGG